MLVIDTYATSNLEMQIKKTFHCGFRVFLHIIGLKYFTLIFFNFFSHFSSYACVYKVWFKYVYFAVFISVVPTLRLSITYLFVWLHYFSVANPVLSIGPRTTARRHIKLKRRKPCSEHLFFSTLWPHLEPSVYWPPKIVHDTNHKKASSRTTMAL